MSIVPEKLGIVLRAAALSRRAHEGQVRKYTGLPYATHPASVANRCLAYTDDPEIIAAAYLHDVLEDTDVKRAEIIRATSERVYGFVFELTDQFTSENFPHFNRDMRKKLEANRLRFIPWEAKLVKICDIADNAESIEEHDPGFAKVWLPEKYRAMRALLGGSL